MHFDIVVFLDADWAIRAQRNRQHFLIAELVRQLEGRSKVLGIERPVCPWTNPFRKREKFVQWLRGERGLRQAGANLYLYTPFVFIHNVIAACIPGMTALNRCLLRALLKRVLKHMEFCTFGWFSEIQGHHHSPAVPEMPGIDLPQPARSTGQDEDFLLEGKGIIHHDFSR